MVDLFTTRENHKLLMYVSSVPYSVAWKEVAF